VAIKLADGWRIVSKSYRYDLSHRSGLFRAIDAAAGPAN